MKEGDRAFFRTLPLIAAAVALLAVFSLKTEAPDLSRPKQGEQDKSVDMTMVFSYEDVEITKDVTVEIRPKAFSRQEADEAMEACRLWLWEHLSKGELFFPESYAGQVEIQWENNDFSWIGIEGPTETELIAKLSCGDYSRLTAFPVTVVPTKDLYEKSLYDYSEAFVEALSDSDSGAVLAIPQNDGGVAVRWTINKTSDLPLIICLGIFVGLLLYFSRYDSLKKQLQKRNDAFHRELSNMSLQLILLLNCGLVTESAFSVLIERNKNSENPLYKAMSSVREKAYGSNNTFSAALYAYAGTTSDRDFVRFATLVAEHAESGSSLCEKLEQERARMYGDRLDDARARAGQAESKLCLPLMILLLVLVAITALPAMMAM